MAYNSSNKSKTLKDLFDSLPSDIWSIDRMQKFCNYRDVSIICDCLILDDYREYFDQFLEEVDVDEKFYYSPAAFAEYYYGTPDLDFLVMYFSKITTLFEFTKPKIKVLSLGKLKDLNQLIVYYKKEVEDSKQNPTEYKVFNEIIEARDVIKQNYTNKSAEVEELVVELNATNYPASTASSNSTEMTNKKNNSSKLFEKLL